jgi:hypothetical protein
VLSSFLSYLYYLFSVHLYYSLLCSLFSILCSLFSATGKVGAQQEQLRQQVEAAEGRLNTLEETVMAEQATSIQTLEMLIKSGSKPKRAQGGGGSHTPRQRRQLSPQQPSPSPPQQRPQQQQQQQQQYVPPQNEQERQHQEVLWQQRNYASQGIAYSSNGRLGLAGGAAAEGGRGGGGPYTPTV